MESGRVFSVFAACLLLGACATGAPEGRFMDVVWPMPPEPARVRFSGEIRTSQDVEKPTFLETLFGKDEPIGLIKPLDVAVRDGVLYVTDVQGVLVFDLVRGGFRIIGEGQLSSASAVAVTRDGLVWVADAVRKSLYAFGLDGVLRKDVGPGAQGESLLDSPSGIAVDDETGNVWVTDAGTHRVLVFDEEGRLVTAVGGRGTGPGEFNFPRDISVCRDGLVYVADMGNFRIQVLDRAGHFVRVFGSVGSEPGAFARPKGVACDGEGHIYVVDAAFGNFQVFSPEGRALLAVGQPGKLRGEFLLPAGIAIDSENRIYVVDQLNQRVQVFRYLPEEARGKGRVSDGGE